MSQNLFFVNWNNFLFGFHLDDDFAFDDDVGPKAFLESQIVPNDWYRKLPYHIKTAFFQFISKNNFVYRFKQSGTESLMDFVSRVNNLFSNFIFRWANNVIVFEFAEFHVLSLRLGAFA